MEKWIQAVGCEPEKFNETQKECLNYGVFIRMAACFPLPKQSGNWQNGMSICWWLFFQILRISLPP